MSADQGLLDVPTLALTPLEASSVLVDQDIDWPGTAKRVMVSDIN